MKKYIGAGDHFDFGKMKSFMGEHATGRKFNFEAENTSVVDKVIAIAPSVVMGMATADLDKQEPDIDAYVIEDGDLITELDDGEEGTDGKVSLKSLNSKNPLSLFLHYVYENPTRVVKMFINSDKKEFFSQTMQQRVFNPWNTSNKELDIDLSNYVNAYQNQVDRTKISLLKENKVIQFAPDTIFIFKIPAKTKVQFNLEIGAVMNRSEVMRKRAKVAHINIVEQIGRSLQKDENSDRR